MVTEMWEMPWWSECQVTTHTLLTGEFNIEISINQTDSGMPQSWDQGERGPVIDIFWCRVCHYRVSQYTGTFAFPSHTQMVMHPSCRRFNFSYYIVADKGPKMVIWFAGRPMNMNHDQFISCHVVKTREDPYTIVHPSQSFVCDQFMVLVLMGSKLVKLINPIDNILVA